MSSQTRSLVKTVWTCLLFTGTSSLFIAVYVFKLDTRFSYWPWIHDRPYISVQTQANAEYYKPRPNVKHKKTNFMSLAHPSSSTMYMKNQRPVYDIGDIIQVDIVLKDHGGRRKSRGGDMVRIWVKDLTNRACSSGTVIDNNDGSYRGVIKLLWAGNITIVAGIAASRELVELVSENVRIGRSPRQMMGKFEKGEISEIRKCSPMEKVTKHYRKTCNLTYMNSNLPWFCESPGRLSCKDWSSYGLFIRELYTQGEQKILNSASSNLQIPKTIRLTVRKEITKPLQFLHLPEPNIACNNLSPKTTWSIRTPLGYMYRRKWYATQCIHTFDGSVEAFTKCLQGRKLWMIGDSTLRQFFVYFQKLLDLELISEKWDKYPWSNPSLLVNSENTTSVFWGAHALPYCNARPPRFKSFGFAKGTYIYIDEIPAGSRDIIVIHFYLHFMAYDPSVIRNHIRKAVESIKALRRRAPDVKVVIKGPHAFKTVISTAGQLYDFWGVVYNGILAEEFASVADDVIFLNLWDITVAAESWDRHPNHTVLVPVIRQMMAYVCP